MKTAGGSIKKLLCASFVVGGCAAVLLFAFAGTPSYAASPGSGGAVYAVLPPAHSPGAATPAVAPTMAASPSALPSSGTSETGESAALKKSETVMVPTNAASSPRILSQSEMPPTTTEIPQALPNVPEAVPNPTPPDASKSGADNGSLTLPDGQIVNYQHYQDPAELEPQLHSLQEFMAEGDETSPLGIEVREARRKLKSGELADGLLIVGVMDGSPAAKAGLHAYHRVVRDVLEGATIAAALVFAPAVLAVPVVDQLHIGETYDMIIGVDGARVTNFLQFEDRMRDVQPGEIVYLSIVRDGARMQVPVKIPSNMAASAF
jgi:hypothetical protein